MIDKKGSKIQESQQTTFSRNLKLNITFQDEQWILISLCGFNKVKKIFVFDALKSFLIEGQQSLGNVQNLYPLYQCPGEKNISSGDPAQITAGTGNSTVLSGDFSGKWEFQQE